MLIKNLLTKYKKTMQKKMKDLFEADQIVGGIIAKNKDQNLEQSKFLYAWKKFYRLNIQSIIKEFQEKIADIRIKYASEDKDHILQVDNTNPRGYKYSKENLIKCIEEERNTEKELEEKMIEVQPYYCPQESLLELTDEQIESLTGLIIEPKA
jgi:hypothetical protein